MANDLNLSGGTPDAAVVERATLRRVTRRIIPFVFLLYIVNYLDRVNVGFAALEMNRDLHFTASVYGLGAGSFFLSYALFELPSNLILVRVGARRWIARIMITWGLIASAMMFVRTPLSFYVLRIALGAAEAGFFPGIIYYLSCWYPAAQQARAISRFAAAIPLSSVVSGAMAGPLLGLGGRLGLAGWQWLFLVEGIPAILLGFVVLRYLTEWPEDAHWLPTHERTWLVDRLRTERARCLEHHPQQLRHALGNPTVWRLFVWAFMSGTCSFTYNLWGPQVARAISGLSDARVGLLFSAMSLAGGVAMVLNGAHSDRTRERCFHIAVPAVVMAAGFAAAATVHAPVLALVGLTLVSIGWGAQFPPSWAIPATFLTGQAAAAGMALINSGAAIGGFVGPYVFGAIKDATGTFTLPMLILALVALALAGTALWLRSSREVRLALGNTAPPTPITSPA